MATYKHESGETVIAVDKSFEDTRIGVLVEDGKAGWSRVDESTDPEQSTTTAAPATSTKPAAAKSKVEG